MTRSLEKSSTKDFIPKEGIQQEIKMMLEKLSTKDFIPKKETQQEEFLKRYPEYDGRGLLIAIIDSGIDVSLDGLQKTSTGLPKILDCFDFTGTSNVDTSMVRKAGKNKTIILLSGKKVNIPKNWKNPSNVWHLGIKALKEIIPETQAEFDTVVTKKLWSEIVGIRKTKHDNIDCIVWNDGKKWRACILPLSSESFKNVKVLTNFRDEHEYCFINVNVSCCVTIENDGNLLHLFTPYHDHGTLVAQVAAAHYPYQPEKDGLAPGAQIVSMDTKNGSNSRIIEEAFNKCIELGVDIVNISVANSEFKDRTIIDLIKKMVYEHGIIMVQSAGNFGPVISSMRYDTLNSNEEMITIGSLFTNDIMTVFGKENDENPTFVWHYSSIGPLPNGARGVTVVAPSDAIIETPKWHPSKKRCFNGTSCASPVAAGAIACLLSALKANSIEYTFATIKTALSNTAFLPDDGDKLKFGNGIIQINSAFEYFKKNRENLPKIIFPQITLRNSKKEGFIISKSEHFYKLYDYCIEINNDGEKQIPWILKLMPENHKHIKYSKTVTNNLFNVKIYLNELEPGNQYYSEIQGFDPSNLSIGPLFYFPITVIVPEKIYYNIIEKDVFVTVPDIFKLFLQPLEICNECVLKLQNPETGEIYCEKIVKKTDSNDRYDYKNQFIFVPNGIVCNWVIDIYWEKVFEICIYQFNLIEIGFSLNACLKIYFRN